jgi:hypothetical protein
MRRKRLIVSCLLPAYLLLVLHAVIPHHHHFSTHEGPLSFHHGFNAHHSDHVHAEHHDGPDGHGHTAHFVHSPEFGNAMVRPGIKWIDGTFAYSLHGIIESYFLNDRNITQDLIKAHFPESPPHYTSHAVSAPALRGPPFTSLI